MNRAIFTLLSLLTLITGSTSVLANSFAPRGSASMMNIDYVPQKVLYDVNQGSPNHLAEILDRASHLYKITGSDLFESSIVLIIHGDTIPLFAKSNLPKYKELMIRAQNLTMGTPIEFRICQAQARLMNLQPTDIHGFVKMVPMADAEIVRLQKAGYAYMH